LNWKKKKRGGSPAYGEKKKALMLSGAKRKPPKPQGEKEKRSFSQRKNKTNIRKNRKKRGLLTSLEKKEVYLRLFLTPQKKKGERKRGRSTSFTIHKEKKGKKGGLTR